MLLWWDDTITDLIKKIKLIKMGILQNQKYLDKKCLFVVHGFKNKYSKYLVCLCDISKLMIL